ncbi:hypothetical protein C0J45_0956 [Silurus meridionalis]|nr:hypothetical protein C0J45_0956 [Silurus meridionalis]
MKHLTGRTPLTLSLVQELLDTRNVHKHTSLPSVNIQGKDIVRVDKYLGVHLNNKLDWTYNTEAIYKKGQSGLFLLRRLRSFEMQGELLKTFFYSVVASAIFYGVVCWGSSISTARDWTNRSGSSAQSWGFYRRWEKEDGSKTIIIAGERLSPPV